VTAPKKVIFWVAVNSGRLPLTVALWSAGLAEPLQETILSRLLIYRAC
jgi:hypothetical protein